MRERQLNWCQLAVCLATLVSLAECGRASYCSKVENEGPSPPSISNIFQAKIEMKDKVRNKSTEMEMWFESEQQLARLNMLQESTEYDAYYSFKTQEIFIVSKEVPCTVFNMTARNELVVLIGKSVNGKIVPKDTMSMFRLNPEFGIKYFATDTKIRGIASDRWYSCQSWPEMNSELEVNWYFSKPGWSSPSAAPIPLRIEMHGVRTESNITRNFYHVYDFVQFRNYLESPMSVFQTPQGTYCRDRIRTKPLPDLHPIMTFTWEVIAGRAEALDSVFYGRLSYDSSQNMVRYDYREPESMYKGPFYNIGTLTVIHDFNSGVAYYIDGVRGNCTDQAIGSEFIDTNDVDIIDSPGWHLVELRSPKDLFRFDDSYQYEGKGMVRGLPVDIYISLCTMQTKGLVINVTYEYFILDESVTEIAIGKGQVGLGKSVPIELRITSYNADGSEGDPSFSHYERYNFFNFEVSDPDSSTGTDVDQLQPFQFDVGSCYTQEQRLNFVLKFSAINGTMKPKDMNLTELFIRSAVKVLVASDMGLASPIRFQHPQLDYDDKYLYLTVTLLDKPHIYSQFIKVDSSKNPTVLRIDDSAQQNNEESCLESCNTEVSSGCNTVAFCSGPNLPQGRNCLYSALFGYQKNTQGAYTCSVFVRPTNSSSRVSEQSLEEAWFSISSVVNSGQFLVPIVAKQGRSHTFRAMSVERFEIRPDVYNPLRGRHLQQFDAIERLSMRDPKRQVENKVSADDCALACLDETEFKCQSVTYCYDLGVCYLSEDAPDEGKTNTLDRARCNIYIKNELAKYRQLQGTSRIYITGKKPSGVVTKPDQCATLCDQRQQSTESNSNSTDVGCRSFDVCSVEGKQQCYLDSGHLTDDTGITGNRSECTHYSRSFVVDFVRSTTLTDPLFQDLKLFGGLTEDRCARKCTEEFGLDCQGYYFCNATGDCAILTLDAKTPPESDSGTGLKCDYLKRLYNPDGTKYQTTKPQTGEDTRVGLTTGAAAAVFVTTSVIGMVLGIVMLMAVLHSRGNPIWRDTKAFFTRR
ncbi:hypothetical protein BOX15_Mlig002642g3 [Macrostomum lignano]|uniref:Apple domain-containing protein n=1 Tax=Macrostomum lignano TaxID=282301 RepID=A0A267DXV5_9PLAT|nr:hypothetical protein BOX15_Mlig002642g3 [Macrostomum lignano]